MWVIFFLTYLPIHLVVSSDTKRKCTLLMSAKCNCLHNDTPPLSNITRITTWPRPYSSPSRSLTSFEWNILGRCFIFGKFLTSTYKPCRKVSPLGETREKLSNKMLGKCMPSGPLDLRTFKEIVFLICDLTHGLKRNAGTKEFQIVPSFFNLIMVFASWRCLRKKLNNLAKSNMSSNL